MTEIDKGILLVKRILRSAIENQILVDITKEFHFFK